MKSGRSIHEPYASYILLCDALTQLGGKHQFYGVFDRIFSPEFPCLHPQAWLAVEIQGPANTEEDLVIVFRDAEENDVIPPHPAKVPLSPFGSANLNLQMQGLPLPKPGFFSFQVLWNDKTIGSRTLHVEKIQ